MADYQAVVDAIDAAILNWVGEPITISQSGRALTYRTIDELTRARKYYARLASAAGNPKGFKVSVVKNGGPR